MKPSSPTAPTAPARALNPDWYLKASTLRLDAGRDVGVAGKTTIYFKGVPIMGAPGLSFSLSGARRSGWLPPTVGFGSKGRAELMVPYYFNIAPNRDLTLYPRWMLDGAASRWAPPRRYLGETDSPAWLYQGQTHVEYLLPTTTCRHARPTAGRINSQHAQAHRANGLSLRLEPQFGASDNEYPSDFSQSMSSSAERQLLRELRTDYRGELLEPVARAQSYQVLQDPAAADRPESLTVPRPIRPAAGNQLFHAGRYDVAGFDWAVDSELTRFSHPTCINRQPRGGDPADQLSDRAARLLHHAQADAARQRLRARAAAPSTAGHRRGRVRKTLSRVLPTFSLDSGLVFERDAKLAGRQMTQTLEPRLFYVYTPYKDQSKFPTFDTYEATFNFSPDLQREPLHRQRTASSDANQVTAALVSRFLEANGAERLRLALGQRFLPERPARAAARLATPRTESRSDVLLAANPAGSPRAGASTARCSTMPAPAAWSTANYGRAMAAGREKVLNAEYRYLRDNLQEHRSVSSASGRCRCAGMAWAGSAIRCATTKCWKVCSGSNTRPTAGCSAWVRSAS